MRYYQSNKNIPSSKNEFKPVNTGFFNILNSF